ncbi:MAG: DUF4124 domain-containing protein [Stenotrophobium sp.]
MMIRSAVAVTLLALTGLAFAGSVYKWTDAQGHVHYGDNPAKLSAQKLDIDAANGEKPPATKTDTAAQKAKHVEDCSRKRDQLATYKSAGRIIEKDNLGKEHEYTADERKQLIEQTQKQIDTDCADVPASDQSSN